MNKNREVRLMANICGFFIYTNWRTYLKTISGTSIRGIKAPQFIFLIKPIDVDCSTVVFLHC
jgi:hypothetical protein